MWWTLCLCCNSLHPRSPPRPSSRCRAQLNKDASSPGLPTVSTVYLSFPRLTWCRLRTVPRERKKADPDDDRPLEFKPEHHVSANEVDRNLRSRPNSGALIGLYARPEHQHDEVRHREDRCIYHHERVYRGRGLHHGPRRHSHSGERRRETRHRQEERLRHERRHNERRTRHDNGGIREH